MTFAQINTKGRLLPGGEGEPMEQSIIVFSLDKVLDIATDGPIANHFLIRLQDGGEACTTSVVLQFAYPGLAEPPNITLDQVKTVNDNLIGIMNDVLTGSYTETLVNITDTILKGAVSSEGKQPFVTGAQVTSTQPDFA